jgi:hypothetical protein
MAPYADLGITAQQQHDEATKQGIRLAPNSRKTLEALLAKKEKDSSAQSQSDSFDPIALRMSQVAGLTREEAELEASNLGFLQSLPEPPKSRYYPA